MSARNMAKRTAAGTLALAVCLGGGALALAGAAQADANFKFDSRIAGDDRYETAIAASKAAFPTDGKTENVVLVNGFATVDGLTASYLAGVANAPILYVSDKGADAKTQAEIKRLGVKNVWLVGGTTVIPQSVEDAIKVDYKVTRINGSDRYETAKLIAEAGAKISGKQPSKVFVASGTSFADALAVSPVAYAKGYAIALTEKDKTSDYTKAELKAIGSDAKILVGGTAVVSDSVKSDLGVSTRVAGDDRAVTANLVSDWAKASEGFTKTQAALVGGTNGNGADSLVASSVLGKSLTTLHFAGWDATNVYLKDHAAELTGKGVVFGGKAAVNDDQVAKAQAAAQTIAVVKGFTVLSYTSGTTFTYSDPAAKAVATATFSSNDKFTVDGGSASMGAFQAALEMGDVVSISQNTPSTGVTTYALTNKKVTAGVVGFVDTGADSAKIIDPVTGEPLTVGISLAPTYALYKVDGAAVNYAAFKAEIQEGDALEISGGDGTTSVATTRTFSLTNATVSGSVETVSASSTAPAFSVRTAAGAVLGDNPAAAASIEYVLSSSDILTVDGTSVNVSDFNDSLSAGDQVSVSRKAGKYTVALTNAAPTPLSGVAESVTVAAGVHTVNYFTGTGASTVPQVITAVNSYKVDGATVTRDEFEAALTPGDSFTFQADNSSTSSVNESSASLTNSSLVGKVADVQSSTVDVLYAGTTGVLKNNLNYSTDFVFSGNTAKTYFVNGASKSVAQFSSELSLVGNGSKLGTLEVVDNGATTEYKLTSAANTAPATLVSVTTPGVGTSVVVTFSKPVYLSDTFAASDFAVAQGATAFTVTAVSPSTAGSASNTVTLTTSSNVAAASTTVTLSSTGAAKMLDANGTAATAGAKTS